jgi:hypothetical protein
MNALPVALPATGACLAEKTTLTNRIRRQFARIKAVRGQSTAIMVTLVNRGSSRRLDVPEAEIGQETSGP